MRTKCVLRTVACATTFAVACGGSGGADDGDDQPIDAHVAPHDAVPGPDAAPGNTATARISAAGGVIEVGAVEITFPANAFTVDTDVTLTRDTTLFLAPNGVPDGFCGFSDIYTFTPARSFPVATARPIIRWAHSAASPSTVPFQIALDGTTFSDGGGNRVGDAIVGAVDRLGRLFLGHDLGSTYALSPASGPVGTRVYFQGGASALTGLSFRPVAGGAETAASYTYAEGLSLTVPQVTAGPYAIRMHMGAWECGDLPGTFTVTAAP